MNHDIICHSDQKWDEILVPPAPLSASLPLSLSVSLFLSLSLSLSIYLSIPPSLYLSLFSVFPLSPSLSLSLSRSQFLSHSLSFSLSFLPISYQLLLMTNLFLFFQLQWEKGVISRDNE